MVELQDSHTGESKADEIAYDLIMKDKERLLSFEEPVAFIFSHSALREGWDNPNIFQICTLNQTASEMKKRQEVGRGVRLAVVQDGNRVHDEKINVLTVVANESYERYVEKLQAEIEEDYGRDGSPPKPANARKRQIAKLRKHYTLKPEFKELWDRIKHKTHYAVRIDSERLLDDIVREIDKAEILPPRITISKALIGIETNEDKFGTYRVSEGKIVSYIARESALPNLIEIMAHHMEHTTPPMRLTRRTLLDVFKRTKNKKAAMGNPEQFACVAVTIIKDILAEHLINGIEYKKINEWYEMSQLESEISSWAEYLVPAEYSVYDNVICDSDVEINFVKELEKRDDVRLFLKLPGWFTVLTPVGEYNPDWAIVLEDFDEHGQPTGKPLLYLVRETKGQNWKTDMRINERRKITCGERHFINTLNVDYKVVSSAKELP